MSEKNLPLDPGQLSLFTGQEMSSTEKAELEEEALKAEGGDDKKHKGQRKTCAQAS